MMLQYSADDLRQMLPHRHPFVMLDRVEDVQPGVTGIGVKNISISDPVFAGHFPQLAIYPGVLMVEAAGHTCGIVEMADAATDTERQEIGFLAGIRKFSFKQTVHPGDQLRIRVTRRAGLGALYEYECTLTVDSRVVAEGNIAIASQVVGR